MINSLVLYAQNGQYSPDYLNTTLTTEQRVDDLVSRMSLKEKLRQLFSAAPAIPRLQVPAYNYWNECLHGVARAGKATVFPQAIGLAASFDQEMIYKVGTAISDEGRAKHHHFVRNDVRSIYTGLTYWSPNINIFRDPRWGRGQETYGEDPFLTGLLATQFVKGLQGDDPDHLKAVATIKHFAVHSGPEFSRHSDNFYTNNIDLYNTYLPAFGTVVKDANVQSVMCAYNRFRDQPCCGSYYLLEEILRKQMGFTGYVVSDCGAISDFYKEGTHQVVDQPSQALGWSLSAGTDLNCEESKQFMEDHIEEAVAKGIISESDIDRSVKRLFTARFKLGLFDTEDQQKYAQNPHEVVGSKRHQQINLEASQNALVLMKNNGILPLDPSQKIALIGPNADNIDVLFGNYNGLPIAPSTPLIGLKKAFGENQISFSKGSALTADKYGHYDVVPAEVLFHKTKRGKLKAGLKATYFNPKKAEQSFTQVDRQINFTWEKTPLNQQIQEQFSVKWEGILIPQRSGQYRFGGNVETKIKGKKIHSIVDLKKGEQYEISISYQTKPAWYKNSICPQAEWTWVQTDFDYQKEAIAIAKKAEVIVFCGGISPRLEGEEGKEMDIDLEGFYKGDRTSIDLPQVQQQLFDELYQLNKPIIYVNFSGSAIAFTEINQKAEAVIQAFYPGERTGDALANLLLGKYQPQGRLPVTFYQNLDQMPAMNDYSMQERTYRYFSGKPLYRFGAGLDFSTTELSKLELPAKLTAGENLKGTFYVKNTGNEPLTKKYQVYFSSENAPDRSIKKLVQIVKVELKGKHTQEIAFEISTDNMGIYDADLQKKINEGKASIEIFDGKQQLVGQFEIVGSCAVSTMKPTR
ncbi:beta-glucosidase [Persicobacter diffluens]